MQPSDTINKPATRHTHKYSVTIAIGKLPHLRFRLDFQKPHIYACNMHSFCLVFCSNAVRLGEPVLTQRNNRNWCQNVEFVCKSFPLIKICVGVPPFVSDLTQYMYSKINTAEIMSGVLPEE